MFNATIPNNDDMFAIVNSITEDVLLFYAGMLSSVCLTSICSLFIVILLIYFLFSYK